MEVNVYNFLYINLERIYDDMKTFFCKSLKKTFPTLDNRSLNL